MFKVEKAVKPFKPITARVGRRPIYPFGSMEVGDSFLVKQIENAQTARNSAWAYGKNHGRKFTARTVENGLRIWRIA